MVIVKPVIVINKQWFNSFYEVNQLLFHVMSPWRAAVGAPVTSGLAGFPLPSTGSDPGHERQRDGAAAGRRRLRGPQALDAAAQGPGADALHQPPNRRGADPGAGGRRDRRGGAAGRPAARHGGRHGRHLRGDRAALRTGGAAPGGGADRQQGAAPGRAEAPAGGARGGAERGRAAGGAGRQAVQSARPATAHARGLVRAARARVLRVGRARGRRTPWYLPRP